MGNQKRDGLLQVLNTDAIEFCLSILRKFSELLDDQTKDPHVYFTQVLGTTKTKSI